MDVQVEADRRRLAADPRLSRAGFANGGADKLAPIVDQVLARPDQAATAPSPPRGRDTLGALERDEAERRTTVLGRMILAPVLRAIARTSRGSGITVSPATSSSTSVSSIRSASGRNSANISAPPITEIGSSAAKRQRFVDGVRDFRARRVPRAIARQHDVPPPGKQARQAVERLAAHDHDAAHGQRLEALEVGRDVPRQRAVAADHAVLRAGDDEGDGGLAIACRFDGTCALVPSTLLRA